MISSGFADLQRTSVADLPTFGTEGTRSLPVPFIPSHQAQKWIRLASSDRKAEDPHGTLIVHCRFADMSLLEIVTHVEALIFAAFGILISLSGIASLWAFRKLGRLAS